MIQRGGLGIGKMKALASISGSGSSMVESGQSYYQLLQRCWVSGTAKGKGKIKEGKPLKRSKVTTKKTTAAPAGGGPRRRSEFDELVDECLGSAPPIRYLKPDEKAREAEREKMGLKSKAMEEQQKKWKKMAKKKNEFDAPFLMGLPGGLDLISLGLVDADKIPAYELTVEDGRRLAKEYSRVLMRKHRARQAAETALLRCKKEAIEALPEKLKAAALVPDFTPFPINRFMATLTPPIEGYLEKVQEAAKRSAGKEKLR
ncbi:OLC1v1007774C1 [Oldenlandia corymbosa var. corymbosa]|uniref:OLC1v1007774C1 n=1 Tax=Oldenlandia corymbosa var. corymbosa TaxID=529605 RepID=A0AAV1DKF1_OLDCO|nr:OLC1v1007774C1 [Oldenlandia corymbosa var. corymbosa]